MEKYVFDDKEKYLKKKFEQTAELLNKSNAKLSNDIKLKFYGFYKVVKDGVYDIKADEVIGFFDFTQKYKK